VLQQLPVSSTIFLFIHSASLAAVRCCLLPADARHASQGYCPASVAVAAKAPTPPRKSTAPAPPPVAAYPAGATPQLRPLAAKHPCQGPTGSCPRRRRDAVAGGREAAGTTTHTPPLRHLLATRSSSPSVQSCSSRMLATPPSRRRGPSRQPYPFHRPQPTPNT
jgi:hypothetical protein